MDSNNTIICTEYFNQNTEYAHKDKVFLSISYCFFSLVEADTRIFCSTPQSH